MADLLDDDSYQQILRQRLMDKMNQYDRGLDFDSKTAGETAKTEGGLSRDLILNQALQKSAAQIGTLGGKQANTDATDVSTKELLGNQQQGLELNQKGVSDRDKLQQYLMGKMLDQEGSLAKSKENSANKQAELADKAQARKDQAKEKYLDRKNQFDIAGLKADSKGEKNGAQVPGSVAAELGQFDSAVAMADDVMKSYQSKASATGSGAMSLLPGSDASQYEKERDVAAQSIGSILEGGKLTDHDYDRYKAMLPSPTDQNSVAETKVAAIKNLIQQRRKGKIEGLAQTGFDVSGVPRKDPGGFKAVSPSPAGGTANAATPTPMQQKALKFLQDNPNDPAAPAVKAKLMKEGVL